MSNTQEITIQPIISHTKSHQFKMAADDFITALNRWPAWMMLAYQDIKLRYKRSTLGPFWITLSMAITIYTMGFLYSKLFNNHSAYYFSYLASGMLSWALISSLIIELSETFIISYHTIKQVKLPYYLYLHRIAFRNFLIFFHNLFVMIPIYCFWRNTDIFNFHFLLLLPGLLIIYINAINFGCILALLSTRYRDVQQIIRSLIQIIFFITPILWMPNTLPQKDQYLIDFNPCYALIELLRAPMLGQVPAFSNLLVAFCVTLIGFIISGILFAKYRAKIIFWL